MPTVKVKGKKRVFPYNAVGKAQADSFSKMNGGKISYNPNYGMEKKMKSSYQEKMFDELMLVFCASLIIGIKTLIEYVDKLNKKKRDGKKSR